MKRSTRCNANIGIVAAIICAAASLAGCGGSSQAANPATQMLEGSAMLSRSSSTEVLTGTAKLVYKCRKMRGMHGKHLGWSTGFSAHGTATGPYPGTFTANGSWAFYFGRFHGSGDLVESFSITSGSSTISGSVKYVDFYSPPFTCAQVQNLTVPYTIGSQYGSALIDVIEKGDFSETLDGA
jgi:hypothetical protein